MTAAGAGQRRRHAVALLLAAAASCWGTAVWAQAWPGRTVTLVVGSAAGSAPDLYARALAEQWTRQTGGTFVVDNKPGANGNLSAEAVLRAPPDGATLWIGTQSMVTINPAAYDRLRWKAADFKPIVKGVEAPLVLVTHPSVPATTFAELGRWISAHRREAAYASFSPGTPSHFLGFQLNEQLKADLVHVPYKGSAPQVNDLLAGQVPLGFTQLAVAAPHIAAGKLRAIAVTGPRRSPALPAVPTLAELGSPALSTTIWFGVLAPAATPRPVLDAILASAVAAHADPALRARLEAQNFDVPNEAGPAFERAVAAETQRWARLVKASGFSASD